MSDYAWAVELARSLIKDYGVKISVSRVEIVEDPTQPYKPGTEVKTSYDTMGVFTSFDTELVDGTRILVTDRLLVMQAPKGHVVKEKDLIKRGQDVWTVEGLDAVMPADTLIVYRVHVRL